MGWLWRCFARKCWLSTLICIFNLGQCLHLTFGHSYKMAHTLLSVLEAVWGGLRHSWFLAAGRPRHSPPQPLPPASPVFSNPPRDIISPVCPRIATGLFPVEASWPDAWDAWTVSSQHGAVAARLWSPHMSAMLTLSQGLSPASMGRKLIPVACIHIPVLMANNQSSWKGALADW